MVTLILANGSTDTVKRNLRYATLRAQIVAYERAVGVKVKFATATKVA